MRAIETNKRPRKFSIIYSNAYMHKHGQVLPLPLPQRLRESHDCTMYRDPLSLCGQSSQDLRPRLKRDCSANVDVNPGNRDDAVTRTKAFAVATPVASRVCRLAARGRPLGNPSPNRAARGRQPVGDAHAAWQQTGPISRYKNSQGYPPTISHKSGNL